MVQVAPQVVGHGLRRGVPLRRTLLERLAHDVVEVAAQRAAELPGRRAAAGRDLAQRVRAAIGRGRVGETQRLGLHDRVDQPRRRAVCAYGMPPGQEEVEDHAQRVHVGGGGDVPARELLRRRVLGGQRRKALAGQGGHLAPGPALQQHGDENTRQRSVHRRVGPQGCVDAVGWNEEGGDPIAKH